MALIADENSRVPAWTRGGAFMAMAIVVVGVIVQAMGQQICDNSFLITFAEKVYDGATPYVDITDTNLPATWLIYMPAVALMKWTGLRAEAWLVVEILALTLASGLAATRLLHMARLDQKLDMDAVRNAGLFASLVVWGANFGEREHFAVLFLLPLLVVYAARAGGAKLTLSSAVLAGLAGAAAICIKPFYVITLGLPIFAAMVVRRSLRPAFAPENFAVALATLIYYAASYKLTPAYFTDEMPQLTAVYIVGRHSIAEILVKPMTPFMIATLGVLVYLCRRDRDPRTLALTAGAVGFFIAYIVQGKLFFNHALPAIHLIILAFAVEYARRRVTTPQKAAVFLRRLAAPIFLIAPLFGMIHLNLLRINPYADVYETVKKIAPARPSMGAIVDAFSIAFPTIRQLDGVWVGRSNSLWGADIGLYLLKQPSTTPEHRRQIEEVIHTQRAWLAEDLAQGKPDVILVEDASIRARELATSELAHALDGYRHAADAGEVEIWLRDDLAAQGSKS